MSRVVQVVFVLMLSASLAWAEDAPVAAPADPAALAGRCLACHREKSPGLYNQWRSSKHARQDVTCIECHGADAADADAFEHEGALIATLVTPKDCGNCHDQEVAEVEASYHATAGEILESQDAYLAHAAGGMPVTITGCEACHGTKVKIDPASPNKLARESWPNSGIGRINPDGSKGSCNACHTRHAFDKAQARRPEACSKCHLGPDHPQKEVFEESKHGNTYATHVDKMNFGSERWEVGKDYFDAPTCATCHMSAGPGQVVTHDVGQRISWTLRPAVSKMKEGWQGKRDAMKAICSACHQKTFVEGHYYQYDGVVQLYNEKFGKPATEIMNKVKAKGLLARKADFGNDLEWIYWELWHHEGRRARHGAAMMGADYAWWNGMYEVARNFYFKFLPAVKAINDPEVNALVDKLLKDDPMHAWITRSTEDIKADIRSGKLPDVYKELFKPAQ